MEQQGLGTNVICQIGIVVRDIEQTAKAYADIFGMDMPQIRVTEAAEITHINFRGAPTQARAKLAFFQMGSMSLELIEPVGEPSTWKEFLDEHGEGVHHIAFRIKGMDEVLAYLDGKGISAIQRGDYTGGRYAYVDSAPAIGVMLELLENY
ncbi:TPA: VOC family protein [Candidatus Poribacteria bacterium]|nr:VOC family protein [Candidatus Poribacteria bacterium]